LSITIELDLDTARPTARAIQSRLAKLGFDVTLGQAYEVLAAAAGEPEWNVLSAKMKATREAPAKAEAPVSMCVVIELIGPSDPAHYQDRYGITPQMLLEAAETFAAAWSRDPNPTAEVIQENFSEYMQDLIDGSRNGPEPGWAEDWRRSRSATMTP